MGGATDPFLMLQYRPRKHATIPDALSRREQDVFKDIEDTRLAGRQKTLLSRALWVNTTYVHLTCPFSDDDDLQRLWAEALQAEDVKQTYRQARDAVLEGGRTFPKHLDLRIARESEVMDGILHYRELIELLGHEPLTTFNPRLLSDDGLRGPLIEPLTELSSRSAIKRCAGFYKGLFEFVGNFGRLGLLHLFLGVFEKDWFKAVLGLFILVRVAIDDKALFIVLHLFESVQHDALRR